MQFGDINYFNSQPPQPVVQETATTNNAMYGNQPRLFNAQAFKIYGAVLALMAAGTLALGVADVVLTKEAYCNPWDEMGPYWCSTTKEPYIWVWVGVGIWASIPIFLAGVFAMCISANPETYTRVWALLMFLSTIVFAPALVILSGIELWRGYAAEYTFYSMDNGIMMGTIMGEDNPYKAKFAIPLIIAIMGGIMFIMTAIVTLQLCCCMQTLGIYLPGDLDEGAAQAPPQVATQAFAPRPQVTQSQYAIDYSGPQANFGYSRFSSSLPYMPTRYQSVPDPYSQGVSYGNFPSRSGFASDFFSPNPSYFWK